MGCFFYCFPFLHSVSVHVDTFCINNIIISAVAAGYSCATCKIEPTLLVVLIGHL